MAGSAHGRTTTVVLVVLATVVGTSLAVVVPPALADGELAPQVGEAEEPTLGLVVDTVNDADGDGVFSDREDVRGGANAAVAFRVAVTNTSDVPVTITSVAGVMDTTTLDLMQEPYCSRLGVEVAVGASVSCDFTLDRYLRTYRRPPRDELVNEVTVTAHHGDVSVTGSDATTVVNPNAGRVSVDVVLTNDADGDGTFQTTEQAATAAADVPFQVTIGNTSPGTAVLRRLTATWDGHDEPMDLLPRCSLEGTKLRGIGEGHDEGHDDGDSGHDDGHEDADEGHDDTGHAGGPQGPVVTCSLVLEGHAPAPGASRTTTVTVTLAKGHSPDVTATATASSTVSTPAPVVVPRQPAVTLATRVGPVAGPYADHDVAPGLSVSVPLTGAAVAFELEVVNTGETTLTAISIEDDVLDAATCVVPSSLAVGDSFRCLTGSVPAMVGEHVHEATVRALGDGRSVSDSDLAWYRGVEVEGPTPDVSPEPAVDVLPDVQEPAAAPSTPALAPTTPAALPATGIDTVVLVAAGVGALLGGALLLEETRRRRGPATARRGVEPRSH